VLPADAIPSGIKEQLAQLPHPDRNEANALSKLSQTVFKKVFKNILLKSKEFKAGFVCAVVLDLDRLIKDPTMTAQEREALYSLVFPVLGYGAKVDDVSIGKLETLFAQFRFLYDKAPQLRHDLRADFYQGFVQGNEFITIGEKILADGPDSSKTYFLIVLLGKNNRLLRSASDLYRFIHHATNLKLRFDWDSFKKACQDISWHGARFLRSMRSRKLGVGIKPAAP